jgi:hypothetical protein
MKTDVTKELLKERLTQLKEGTGSAAAGELLLSLAEYQFHLLQAYEASNRLRELAGLNAPTFHVILNPKRNTMDYAVTLRLEAR